MKFKILSPDIQGWTNQSPSQPTFAASSFLKENEFLHIPSPSPCSVLLLLLITVVSSLLPKLSIKNHPKYHHLYIFLPELDSLLGEKVFEWRRYTLHKTEMFGLSHCFLGIKLFTKEVATKPGTTLDKYFMPRRPKDLFFHQYNGSRGDIAHSLVGNFKKDVWVCPGGISLGSCICLSCNNNWVCSPAAHGLPWTLRGGPGHSAWLP